MKLYPFMNRGSPVFLSILVFVVSACDVDDAPSAQSTSPQDVVEKVEIDNPIAHWSFQGESETELVDASDHALHGTIYGAKRVEEDGHAALEFNGESDFVELSSIGENNLDNLSQLGRGTISIWFKLGSLPEGKRIYPIFYYGTESACDFFDAANKGMIVEVGHHPVQSNSMRLYFTMWANGCTFPSFCFDSNFPVEADKWYHFVAVVGSSHNTGYLDGVEMSSRRYNFGSSGDSQFFEDAVAHEALWLGKGYWDSEVNFFHGLISDIRIYSEPLSTGQVVELHQATKTQ